MKEAGEKKKVEEEIKRRKERRNLNEAGSCFLPYFVKKGPALKS